MDFKKIKLNKKPVIVIDDNMSEGLIGIIASRITSYFNKPAIIITQSKKLYKGSARSTNKINIGKLIKNAIDNKILENGGGHNLAAGFTLKKRNINKFKKFIYEHTNLENKINKNFYISKISFSALNKNLINVLNLLKPYGEGNKNPFFLIEDIKIFKPQLKKNNYISFFFKKDKYKLIPAVSFNFAESNLFKNLLYNKNKVDIVVQLEESFWNNKQKLNLIIIDIFDNFNKA